MLVSKATYLVAGTLAIVNLVLPSIKGVHLIRQAVQAEMDEVKVIEALRFGDHFRIRLNWTIPDGCLMRGSRGYAISPDAVVLVPVEQSGPDGWSFDLSNAPAAVSVSLETRQACAGELPRPHLLGPWKIERNPSHDHTS